MLVGSRPDNVVVGEVEGRTLIVGLTAGAKTAALGHGNVEHDLDVAGPVTRVGEDKDSVNGNVCEVSLTGVAVLLGSKLAERSGSSVVLNNVARSYNILEAIALGNMSALLALTTDNKNGAILLSHLPHRGVTADELARFDVTLELTREIIASLLLGLATTVGEEDVRPIIRCVSIVAQAEITMLFIMWTSPEKIRG
jgi:hypothetical protein